MLQNPKTTVAQPDGGEPVPIEPILGGANQAVLSAAPLAPLALGLMGGIVAGERWQWPVGIFILVLLITSMLAGWESIRRQLSFLLIAAAGVGLGGVLHWSRERVESPRRIDVLAGQKETIARVRGKVVLTPVLFRPEAGVFSAWQLRQESTAFVLGVDGMESVDGWVPASGLVRVSINEAVLDLGEGDAVEVFGLLMPLRPPPNPGSFDWRGWYRQQGIRMRMFCDQRENVVRLGRKAGSLATWLRAKSRGLLTDDMLGGSAEEASLLEAMVLGHRSRFDRRLNEVFTRAGCVHFIAASGTNIVILMGAMWLAGRMAGLDKRRCVWLIIPAIILYGLVAEPRPPILRACVMGLMFCTALLLQRNSSHLNWIAAAAIILSFINPLTIFDVGFQLSFAAVLGVAYLAPALWHAANDSYWWVRESILRDTYARADLHLRAVAAKFAPVHLAHRMGKRMVQMVRAVALVFVVSFGAWLCSLPITAVWFQQVQTWGVISSVLVYPLISIIMVLGVIKVGAAAVSPLLAWPLTFTLGGIDALLVWIVEKLAALPLASPTISPIPSWLTASYYLLLLSIAICFRRQSSIAQQASCALMNRACRAPGWMIGATALLALCCLAWTWEMTVAPRFTVTVLAVGAGSATVIELPGGQTVVYDAGTMGAADVGSNVMIPFLRYRGITHIDRLYVSHPNLDHFSGIPELLRQVPVKKVIWNRCFSSVQKPGSPAAALLKHLTKINAATEVLDAENTTWNYGGVEFEVFWPTETCAGLSANDSSTVLQLSYGGRSVLFTGDLEEKAQRDLIATADLRSDVLILPHHGSVCASTADFLKSVGASVLIRSSNERSNQTTSALPELVADATFYNTADVGAVTVIIDGDSMRVESWLDPNGLRDP